LSFKGYIHAPEHSIFGERMIILKGQGDSGQLQCTGRSKQNHKNPESGEEMQNVGEETVLTMC
jgi:hypothetical protein